MPINTAGDGARALVSALSVSSILNMLPGGIHPDRAPEESPTPFAVYAIPDGEAIGSLSSNFGGFSGVVVLTICAKLRGEVDAAAKAIIAVMNDYNPWEFTPLGIPLAIVNSKNYSAAEDEQDGGDNQLAKQILAYQFTVC